MDQNRKMKVLMKLMENHVKNALKIRFLNAKQKLQK